MNLRGWTAAGAVLVVSVFLASPARAEDGWSKTGISRSIGFFGGQTLLILGSDDVRRGYGGFFSYGRPEPKFKLWSVPAQLVFEIGADVTSSNGAIQFPPNTHGAVWAFPYARYRFRTRHGMGLYLDAGMGLYYTHQSHDLNSNLLTSPTVDLGVAFRNGPKDEFLVGVRFRHVSNGGTNPPNAGQNGLFLTAEYRF
jgi:hypothetical protein